MFNVSVPAKIGDTAWCIRRHNGGIGAKCGIISDIRFDENMELVFTVKYVGRGKWGEKIFPTYDAAMEVLRR